MGRLQGVGGGDVGQGPSKFFLKRPDTDFILSWRTDGREVGPPAASFISSSEEKRPRCEMPHVTVRLLTALQSPQCRLCEESSGLFFFGGEGLLPQHSESSLLWGEAVFCLTRHWSCFGTIQAHLGSEIDLMGKSNE